MSFEQAYRRPALVRAPDDESDAEEDALVNNYKEQVQFEDTMEELGQVTSMNSAGMDIIAQLAQQVVIPLEFPTTLKQKIISYENYCTLFNGILNSEQPVDLDVSINVWAWEAIDEFIYQFTTFSRYSHLIAFKNENENEIAELQENSTVWGCYSVLNVLYSLIQRSNTSEQLAATKRGKDPAACAGEFGSRPLYRMLGYFSIIGLLRVNCLLGDYSLALKMLDDVELSKKAIFARVMAAHFDTYYYVGFCYMMMRQYSDAIRMFTHISVYVSRTRNVQKNPHDSISKKNDQILSLIAICVAFQPTRLDDSIHRSILEKHGEVFNRLQRGGPESLPVFRDLFLSACPKFVSPTSPDFSHPESNIDPIEHQLAIFMDEVKNNMWSSTVKSYLKLYTTMDLKKLAGFLDQEPEEIRQWLLINKQRSRQIRWSEGGLLNGDITKTNELDYAIEGDLIHIAEAKLGRTLVDWYLRNVARTY